MDFHLASQNDICPKSVGNRNFRQRPKLLGSTVVAKSAEVNLKMPCIGAIAMMRQKEHPPRLYRS